MSTPVRGRPGNGRSRDGNQSIHPQSRGTGRGRTRLIDGPAEFQIFVAKGAETEGSNETSGIGYPEPPHRPGDPTIVGEDPGNGGLFDASTIEKTPNGNVLHHVFEFFQGLVIRKNRGKPYVLRHEGHGRFTSRGQHVNFKARSADELRTSLEVACQVPALADIEPLRTLAGGAWRGVGADIVQFAGNPAESRRILWSVTRVDFYRRGGGRPTHELSALYAIYPNLDHERNPVPANLGTPSIRGMPEETRQAGIELIEADRQNLGRQ